MLFRVTAPYFVAGAIVKNWSVIHAAPTLQFTRGWSQFRFINYCRSRGWKLEIIK